MSRAHSEAAKRRWAALPPEKRANIIHAMNEGRANAPASPPSYVRHKAHARGSRAGNAVVFVLRTDPETFDAVRAIAVRRSVSVAEVVREFVEWGLENGEGQ